MVVFEVGSPIADATHAELLVQEYACALHFGTHPANPLNVVVHEYVAVALLVKVVLINARCVIENRLDLGVRDVAGCAGAGTGERKRLRVGAQKEALLVVAARVGHGEGSSVARNADHNLVGRYTCFCDLNQKGRVAVSIDRPSKTLRGGSLTMVKALSVSVKLT